jgi:hypothetical protein
MRTRKNVLKYGFAAGGISSAPAFAAAPTTIAELTSAISFADVGLGILAVAGLLSAVYVTWKAAKMVVAALRGM